MEVVRKTSWKSSSALYFRRVTCKSSQKTLYNKKPNEEKSDIKTYQNAQIYYERETSSEDFHEVQTTEMEVVWKTSWKSSGRLLGSRLVHYILED
ncbi:hypothetical protein IGI04_023302 [Brassica rapa subsp. trilocularis]|uniref:Uncharacterized protein n=1 Tax=Brassica rapa subsp. trilocularis TaxID=1813537 RepID=A0ABQ7M3H4_BRACM|nr:hypothetical protein IGI04_023302 [Brassica rapa subsp. trilocularis]